MSCHIKKGRYEMRKTALFLVLFCVSLIAMAQDVIVKKDGTTVLSKVLEISSTEIKYKQWSNQDGPLYSINRSEVVSINYENGNVEQISSGNYSSKSQGSVIERLNERMERDGRDLVINGRELSESEVRALVGEENYETYLSARRQVAVGRAFTPVFFVSLGATVIFTTIGLIFAIEDDYYTAASFYIASGVTGGVAGVSLPMMCIFKGIGKGRLDWVANEYNSKNGNTFSYQLSPSIIRSKVPGQQTNVALGVTFSMDF